VLGIWDFWWGQMVDWMVPACGGVRLTDLHFAIDRNDLYGKLPGGWSLRSSIRCPSAPTSHPRSIRWGLFLGRVNRRNWFGLWAIAAFRASCFSPVGRMVPGGVHPTQIVIQYHNNFEFFPDQEFHKNPDLLSTVRRTADCLDTSAVIHMSRRIGFCSCRHGRSPGKDFCLFPWSTPLYMNVWHYVKQSLVFFLCVAGEVPKTAINQKAAQLRWLWCKCHLASLCHYTIIDQKAKPHFAKWPQCRPCIICS
jgi:hypothetical protein